MADNRFKRVEEIYHRALERPEGERAAFVAEACGGDADLRREVESLLSSDGKAGRFMDSPALDVAAQALARMTEQGGSIELAGQTILHYRVLEKVGEGGMGVVYKALDTHLDRFVAIKVLAAERVADPDRKRRFVQEAKAASALNHPNIVTIHDIDQVGGADFIAMEYVNGKTLSQLIPRKGMKLSDFLKYSIQMADALAAAHGSGIVHRDLKPANVMVTEKGLVKVLDFGLAKLTEPAEKDEFGTTETLEPRTEEGTIVGTVAYMSPEQAEGKRVDARSDIFSFGSVLYEMMTGQRAFQGTSKISTLSAILHQEPKQISGVTPGIAADLEKLISRCLRKDPERRIQHMDDVKLALAELKEDSDSGRSQAVPSAARQITRKRMMAGAVGVVALITVAVAAWYWLGRQHPTEPEGPLAAVPLTSYPGFEVDPSFSPDGTQVAFQWCKDPGIPPKDCDIYIKQVGEEQPFQLTSDAADERSPAWSPDARYIAFLRQLSPTKADIVLIPQRGGQERIVGESAVDSVSPLWRSYLAWTPDSKRLVFTPADSATSGLGLSLLSLETLEKRKLTTPPKGADTCPAVSPDGRTLAYTHMRGNAGDSYLLRLGDNYESQGAPEKLAEMGSPGSSAPAWTPDGGEILFVSGDWLGGGLWRMAAFLCAKPRRMAVGADWVAASAISRQGNRLAYVQPVWRSHIWRIDLQGPDRTPGAPFKFILSTRNESGPAFSPDGKRIAFHSNRSGHHEIWVCNSDGSNPAKLTSFGGPHVDDPRWSPDGKNVVFDVRLGKVEIYVISANGGPPRLLDKGPLGGIWPSWSRDGQSIYFKSSEQVWKVPAGGGEAVQITRNGGDVPQESPDGKFLYYMKGWPSRCSVWRMPGGGGEETKVLEPVHFSGHFSIWEQGIYYFAPEDEKGRSDINFYDFATGKTSKILTIERPVYEHIEVSPDGRTILYTQIDETGSDLMLVENFR